MPNPLPADTFLDSVRKQGRLDPRSGRRTLCVDLQSNIFYFTLANEKIYLRPSQRNKFLDSISKWEFDYHYKAREQLE